jgi:hypothetical protein
MLYQLVYITFLEEKDLDRYGNIIHFGTAIIYLILLYCKFRIILTPSFRFMLTPSFRTMFTPLDFISTFHSGSF